MEQPSREVRIPLTWNLTGREILFVGGGQAAFSKLRALDSFKPALRLVAPLIDPAVRDLLASWPEVEIRQREFLSEDLEGMALAYIFTDNPKVNAQASYEARARGIPINGAGDPQRDFTSPASAQLEGFILSVASGGHDISGAAGLRDRVVRWFASRDPVGGKGDSLCD